jgi:hypothetical protein
MTSFCALPRKGKTLLAVGAKLLQQFRQPARRYVTEWTAHE